MVIFHSYVKVYQRVTDNVTNGLRGKYGKMKLTLKKLGIQSGICVANSPCFFLYGNVVGQMTDDQLDPGPVP